MRHDGKESMSLLHLDFVWISMALSNSSHLILGHNDLWSLSHEHDQTPPNQVRDGTSRHMAQRNRNCAYDVCPNKLRYFLYSFLPTELLSSWILLHLFHLHVSAWNSSNVSLIKKQIKRNTNLWISTLSFDIAQPHH